MNIEEKIKELKIIVCNSTNGHLCLSYRVELMQYIKNISTINKCFLECAKYIYPVWKNEFPMDNSVLLILNKAHNYLHNKQGTQIDFEQIVEEYKNYFEEIEGVSGLVGLTALSLCNSIAYNASTIVDIDEYKEQDDNTFDWDVWNPDFYASMAYSGGNFFINEGNTERRREFWNWYLDMVNAIYKSPEKPLLVLEHFPIQQDRPIILQRTQTHQTDSILEKIETIIDATLTALRKEYDVKWEKVIIQACCMKVGVQVKTFFMKGNESFNIKGNLNSFSLMNRVKYEMYEQAKTEGGWFLCTLEVTPDLAYTVNFNYDDMDKLLEEKLKSIDNFKDEFSALPRSKKFTPLWWQEILGKRVEYIK
jgi:hypothetical protein